MAHDVFICYASRDKAVAEAVCTALEAKGIKCWIAPRDVLIGTEWAESIVDALDGSRVLVLVLSANSNASPQVIREVGRAAGNGTPIIPFRIDDVIPSKAMDYFVSSHQWLDAQTGPLEKHLQRLTDTVQQILARRRAPEEVIDKAKREAEEKVKKEAEEARKAREAKERAKREAEKAARERERSEAKEAEEKAKKEAEEAKEKPPVSVERPAKPVKVGMPLLKRRWLWAGAAAVLVALIFVFVFVLGGTGEKPSNGGVTTEGGVTQGEEAPPEEGVAPTTPTTPAAPLAPVELVFNDHLPEGSSPTMAMDYWAEKLEEESEGRLKINVVHDAELFTGDEVYGAVKSGACDGGHYVLDREQGFLLSTVMSLPFMGWPEQHVEDAYWTLLDEFPEMAAEWDGVTIISLMMLPPTHIHTVDKEIRTPTDIKGVKIFCAEASSAEIMNAVGATAVEMDIFEMASSLQTGQTDGVFNHFPVLNVFGALELTHYHTVFDGGGVNMTPMFLIMNTEKLNSLPSDLQDIILNSGHWWFYEFKRLDETEQEEATTFCEENNHFFAYQTPEEVKVWYDLVKEPIHDVWIAECETAGLPGQALYNEVLRLIAEWQIK